MKKVWLMFSASVLSGFFYWSQREVWCNLRVYRFRMLPVSPARLQRYTRSGQQRKINRDKTRHRQRHPDCCEQRRQIIHTWSGLSGCAIPSTARETEGAGLRLLSMSRVASFSARRRCWFFMRRQPSSTASKHTPVASFFGQEVLLLVYTTSQGMLWNSNSSVAGYACRHVRNSIFY